MTAPRYPRTSPTMGKRITDLFDLAIIRIAEVSNRVFSTLHPHPNRKDPTVTDTFDLHKALMDAYYSTPIVDDPRTGANEELGRMVIDEFPAVWPHRDVTDDSVRLPVRLVFNAAMDVGLEIGPYDFADTDIKILKVAIAAWDKIERTRPILPPDEHPDDPEDEPDEHQAHVHAPVTDINTKKRRSVSSLQARLGKHK